MQRMRKLIDEVRIAYPHDHFFDGVRESLKYSAQARAYYRAYDRALGCLDIISWQELSRKAVSHFRDHRLGQLKQGFFHQLNEAFAYQYLVRRGFSHVRVLPESRTPTPDLSFKQRSATRFCEVKTIAASEQEIARRSSESYSTSDYAELSHGFKRKFDNDLQVARRQIAAVGGTGLIFVLANFDDFTQTYYRRYREQLLEFLAAHEALEVYVKVGVMGGRRLVKAAGSTRGA